MEPEQSAMLEVRRSRRSPREAEKALIPAIPTYRIDHPFRSSIEKICALIDAESPAHLETCRSFLRQKTASTTGEGIQETAELIKSFIEKIGGTVAFWAAPYFVFSRILKIPVVAGGLGHGGKQHVANEYMTLKGLRDFEKFVATFLYLMAS
jgi:acetylornithine deacetylase/succinyl-diaminopimelate desuccinylase-like protein